MKFLVILALFALIAGVFLMEVKEKKHEHKEHMKKFLHQKKVCTCIKEHEGMCKKLKCCEIFKYVPYKVLVKYCKYGKCEFIHKKHEEKKEHHEVKAEVKRF